MTREKLFKSARAAIILFCAFLLVLGILVGVGVHTQPFIIVMTVLLLAAIVILQAARPKRSRS